MSNFDKAIQSAYTLKEVVRLVTRMERAFFKVVGMYFIACKPIVERQLKDEKGIGKIDLDYMADSVIVEFDPLLIGNEEIKSKLEKSGYKFVRVAR